jgi:hypothetical protein
MRRSSDFPSWCSLIGLGFLFAGPMAAQPVPDYNSVLGTQAIGGKYQFTDAPAVVETAQVVQEMGATMFKFALPAKHAFGSLAELAARDPAVRQVFDLPFGQFLVWVNAQAEGAWTQGLNPAQVLREYRHVYELTVHLLKTYRGSGKSFYLGHWEGDNMLRGGIDAKGDAKMADAVRVQGFIDWLRIRQQAVDDAKHDTPHEGVEVWHYTEVNHPTISLREGRPSIANKVLPKVAVDFVSYSAYDSQHDPALLRDTLDYLQSKLQPKQGLPEKRVFIGEYGFWTWKDGQVQNTPAQQNDKSLRVIRTALEWGCPFILYWQLYNNERDADGRHRGFWMIDDKGVRQPIFTTHQDYGLWVRGQVQAVRARTGQPPTSEDLRRSALEYFKP